MFELENWFLFILINFLSQNSLNIRKKTEIIDDKIVKSVVCSFFYFLFSCLFRFLGKKTKIIPRLVVSFPYIIENIARLTIITNKKYRKTQKKL
jgi:hypothetical protein